MYLNVYGFNFYQDGSNWKLNLIPIKISKIESDKVIDLILYKNHYALIKKCHVILGNRNKRFVCRQCVNFYRNENTLINHKEKCDDDNICTIKTSSDSYLYCNKHFHKNPLYFRFIVDFEADNGSDVSSTGNQKN